MLSANGLPNHPVGTFPNAGNPNTIRALAVSFTATLTPTLGTGNTAIGGPGVANVVCFTVAHSITLALAAFGVVRIPAKMVEPGIAASIVIMALLNLGFSGSSKRSLSTRGRIAVVFGCGLLHGFGFSSAIGSMAVDTGSRIATLAGFNLGIEIGQFAFLASAMLLMVMARRYLNSPQRFSMSTVASILAAVLGAAMLLERRAPLAQASW